MGQSTYAILMGPKSTAVLALMYTSVYLDTYAPCSLDWGNHIRQAVAVDGERVYHSHAFDPGVLSGF